MPEEGHPGPGLPRSASQLQERVEPITLARLRPGDLLFFELEGGKTSHVAIYVGDREFVHAPSGGKRVERVSFDQRLLAREAPPCRTPPSMNAELPRPPASGVERRRKPQKISRRTD